MPTDQLTVYADPGPFGFDPARTALVLIDMQRDFVEPEGFGETLGNDVSPLRAVIPPLRKVLAATRAARMTVIYTREGHRPDLTNCSPAKLNRGNPTMRIGDVGPKGRLLIRGEYGLMCFLGLFGLLGALIPLPAIVPILLYIGLLIGVQAFVSVPKAHAVAVVMAVIPNVAAWATGQIDNVLNAAGTNATKVGSDALAEAGASPELARALIRSGELVRLSADFAFTRSAYEQAVAVVREMLAQDGSVTVALLRDRLPAAPSRLRIQRSDSD